MATLVTGGAGYIGSPTVHSLLGPRDKVLGLDNLSTGMRAQVGEAAIFVKGDVADRPLVEKTIRDHEIDAVIHFAGSIVVPESVADPLAYYKNNVVKSRDVIAACLATGVKNFIF